MTRPSPSKRKPLAARTRQVGSVELVALAVLLLALIVIGAGLRLHFIAEGKAISDKANQAQRDKELAAQRKTYDLDAAVAQQAASAAAGEVRDLRRTADQLRLERRHAQLLAPNSSCPSGLRLAAAWPAHGTAGLPAASAPGQAAPPDAQSSGPGGGVLLSLDALRLWNSALAGHGVPAGACGAAAGAAGACAADSGRTLDDAWDNQAINALSCAEDRARYRALTTYLRQRHTASP